MNSAITLKDIARRVNKSIVTVSKALRDHPDISKELRNEIKRIAEELGYTPNLLARKLSSHKTRSLGLIVPRIAHPFFSESIEAIYDEAHRQKYDIILMLTGDDTKVEMQHIQSLMALKVDGFLISVAEKTKDISVFKGVLEKGKKIVFFDRIIENLDCHCVVCDDFQGTFNLVSFAIKSGYSRIGYIAGYSHIYIGRERRRGFEEALNQNRIPLHAEWIIEGGFGQKDGYKSFLKLYRCRRLPQLVVTVGYASAMGVLQAMREVGLSIPDDIDLVAFGDSVYNQFLKPPLTVARLDARKIGQTALRVLIESIDADTNDHKKIVIPTQLIVNETGLKPRS
jgi:LacI family transcriptional regulator